MAERWIVRFVIPLILNSHQGQNESVLHAKLLPSRIFTKEYFLNKAKELETLGADMISIKDMAGLIPPGKTGRLIAMLKKELTIPVDFHTHCTPGYGLASTLMAIINGVDIVDTSIGCFAGGPAAPAYELIHIFCQKLNIDTGINLEAVQKISRELVEIRKEMSEFDSYKMFPREFDFTKDKLPKDIEQLFDLAIGYAKAEKEEELLDVTQQIDRDFKFPPPTDLKFAEIPGGI